MEESIHHFAEQTSDLIKQSFFQMMLYNKREDLQETILKVGKEPLIEQIQIYNKDGVINFSNIESQIGKAVGMDAQVCTPCHTPDGFVDKERIGGTTRIYFNPENKRVLELINPIQNSRECSSFPCHAHSPDQKILGILDIQMSLASIDESIQAARTKSYINSIFFMILSLFLIAIIIYIILHIPFKKLRLGTEALADGDLKYRIDLDRHDELGKLAKSFNGMAGNLQQAYEKLQAGSDELEERIQMKTKELEQIYQGMRQVEKMASLGTMAATVAHELNNPLAGIVTYAKLLQRKIQKHLSTDKSKDILDDLDLIRSESMRCGDIVRNLLIFARESSTHFNRHSLNSILTQAISIVKHHFVLSGIEYQIVNELDSDEIRCDFSQLQQALIALFVNAVEAMPGGGQLTITLKQPPPPKTGFILIIIQDSGIGIPEEIKNKIFEPFFSTKQESKGVGLGLAVVYGIIQRHQGKIWVESQEGAGTSFFIELPVDPAIIK
jgi:two-component system NtrC family sensor kinase